MLLKHPKFSSEREYRIIVQISDTRIPYKENEAKKYFGYNNKYIIEDFCVKNGLIVPFLRVKMPKEAMNSVTISPISEFNIAAKGINIFFHAKGFDGIKVMQSKIPVRF